MTSDSGIKVNVKAEYTGWLVALFTLERVFSGWFSGSLLFLLFRSRLANPRSALIDSHEVSRV